MNNEKGRGFIERLKAEIGKVTVGMDDVIDFPAGTSLSKEYRVSQRQQLQKRSQALLAYPSLAFN